MIQSSTHLLTHYNLLLLLIKFELPIMVQLRQNIFRLVFDQNKIIKMSHQRKNPQSQQEHEKNFKVSRQSSFDIHQSSLRDTYRPKLQTNETEKLINILMKPHELRTVSDNTLIGNFIKENIVLTRLSQEISLQFVKDLMKVAIIVSPRKNDIVYKKGEKIKHMGVILGGNISILSQNEEQNNEQPPEISNEDVFDKLFEHAKIYSKEYRKRISLLSVSTSRKLRDQSQTIDISFEKFRNPEIIDIQKIKCNLNQNQLYGFKDRGAGQTFLKTCVCLNNQTTLLIFNEINVMMSLQAAFKQKLKRATSILKGIPCFNFLDLDRIALVIQSLATRKKKRSDLVYKQGNESANFYILTAGEIKVIKQTNLFEENPNVLYSNRKKLIEESIGTDNKKVDRLQKNNKQKLINNSILPYANLTSMYNFRPAKKSIQIGVVTPICLFGEEEYFDRRPRDTSAVCSSLEVEYYEISIKKLQQIIGPKFLPIFNEHLRELARKKLLYRQAQYAVAIQLENNNNMNYFYLQENEEQAPSPPRRINISRLNNIIQGRTPPKSFKFQQNIEPTFTPFNFHKMKAPNSKMEKLSLTERKPKETNYTDPNEQRIIDVTHTWKYMKEKVDKQLETSRRISPVKLSINLKKPLLSSDFFFKIQKESKRIDREQRKRIFSLSNSFQVRNIRDKSLLWIKQ